MANKMDNIVNTLTDIIDDKNKTQAYEVEATVVRIDGNTAWVHIPGGVDETPVQLTIAANVGDMVHVRVANGRATLSGNYTAPPTDDTTAIAARTVAKKAQAAAQQAQEVAEGVAGTAAQALSTANDAETLAQAAQEIANATNQHFWVHPTTGAIYITTQEQDDYLTAPSGRALLITTEGMLMQEQTTEGGATTTTLLATFTDDGTALYQDGKLAASMTQNGVVLYGADGVTAVAQFATDGVQIGQTGQTHTEIDYHSLQLTDKEGNTYFHVSDLRDEDGRLSETFIGDGMHMSVYTFASIDTSKPVTVTIDGIATTAYTLQTSGITFDSMPPDGSVIVVTYTPVNTDTKAYTLGKRSADSIVGIFSYAEGYDVQATGQFTHAEGGDTEAHGAYSHAEGFDTQSYGDYSHAEGMSSRASGEASHAEGSNTVASGQWAHTQNVGTKANGIAQTAIGKYNNNQSNNALEIGNGTDDNNRSNALTVDWSGNVKAAGDIEDGAGNTLAALADLLTVKSLSPTFNSTTGNMVIAYARRQGNIVWVSVAVNNNAAVASGRNIYQGNMSGVPYPPRFIVAGGYYGGNSIAGSIGANGDLVVRNASPSSVTISGSNIVTMSFVYIVD